MCGNFISSDEFVKKLKKGAHVDTNSLKIKRKTLIHKLGGNNVTYSYMESNLGKVVIKDQSDVNKVSKAVSDYEAYNKLAYKLRDAIGNWSYTEAALEEIGITRDKIGKIDWSKLDDKKLNEIVKKYSKWNSLYGLTGLIDGPAEFWKEVGDLDEKKLQSFGELLSKWSKKRKDQYVFYDIANELNDRFGIRNRIKRAVEKLLKEGWKVKQINKYKDGYVDFVVLEDPKSGRTFTADFRDVMSYAMGTDFTHLLEKYADKNTKIETKDRYLEPRHIAYDLAKRLSKTDQYKGLTENEIYRLIMDPDSKESKQILQNWQLRKLKEQGYITSKNELEKILQNEKIVSTTATGNKLIIETKSGKKYKLLADNPEELANNIWNYRHSLEMQKYFFNKKLPSMLEGAQGIRFFDDNHQVDVYKNGKYYSYVLSEDEYKLFKNVYNTQLNKITYGKIKTPLGDFIKFNNMLTFKQPEVNGYASPNVVKNTVETHIMPELISPSGKVIPLHNTKNNSGKNKIKQNINAEKLNNNKIILSPEDYEKYKKLYDYYSKRKKLTVSPELIATMPYYERLAIQNAYAQKKLKLYDLDGNEVGIITIDPNTTILQGKDYIKVYKNGVLSDYYQLKGTKIYKNGTLIGDILQDDNIQIEGIQFFKGMKNSYLQNKLDQDLKLFVEGDTKNFKLKGTYQSGDILNEKGEKVGEYHLINDNGEWKIVGSFNDKRGVVGVIKSNLEKPYVEMSYNTIGKYGQKYGITLKANDKQILDLKVKDLSSHAAHPSAEFLHNVAASIPFLGMSSEELKLTGNKDYETDRLVECIKLAQSIPIIGKLGFDIKDAHTGETVSSYDVGSVLGNLLYIFDYAWRGALARLVKPTLHAAGIAGRIAGAVSPYISPDNAAINIAKQVKEGKNINEIMSNYRSNVLKLPTQIKEAFQDKTLEEDAWKMAAVAGTGLNIIGAIDLAYSGAKLLPQLVKGAAKISSKVATKASRAPSAVSSSLESVQNIIKNIKIKKPTLKEFQSAAREFANAVREVIKKAQYKATKKLAEKIPYTTQQEQELFSLKGIQVGDKGLYVAKNNLLKAIEKWEELSAKDKISHILDLWNMTMKNKYVVPKQKIEIGRQMLKLGDKLKEIPFIRLKAGNKEIWIDGRIPYMGLQHRVSHPLNQPYIKIIGKKYHGPPVFDARIGSDKGIYKVIGYADYYDEHNKLIKGMLYVVENNKGEPIKEVKVQFINVGGIPFTHETIRDLKTGDVKEYLYVDLSDTFDIKHSIAGVKTFGEKIMAKLGTPIEPLQIIESENGKRIALVKSKQNGKHYIIAESPNMETVVLPIGKKNVPIYEEIFKLIKNSKSFDDLYYNAYASFIPEEEIVNFVKNLAKKPFPPKTMKTINEIVGYDPKNALRVKFILQAYPMEQWKNIFNELKNAKNVGKLDEVIDNYFKDIIRKWINKKFKRSNKYPVWKFEPEKQINSLKPKVIVDSKRAVKINYKKSIIDHIKEKYKFLHNRLKELYGKIKMNVQDEQMANKIYTKEAAEECINASTDILNDVKNALSLEENTPKTTQKSGSVKPSKSKNGQLLQLTKEEANTIANVIDENTKCIEENLRVLWGYYMQDPELIKKSIRYVKPTTSLLEKLKNLVNYNIPIDKIYDLARNINRINAIGVGIGSLDPNIRTKIKNNIENIIKKLDEEVKKAAGKYKYANAIRLQLKRILEKVRSSVNPADIISALMELLDIYLKVKPIVNQIQNQDISQKIKQATIQKTVQDTIHDVSLDLDIDISPPPIEPPPPTPPDGCPPETPYSYDMELGRGLSSYLNDAAMFWKEVFKGLRI